jgi:hypothetical protein
VNSQPHPSTFFHPKYHICVRPQRKDIQRPDLALADNFFGPHSRNDCQFRPLIAVMSFSTLVQDLAVRGARGDEQGSQISVARSVPTRSYTSTSATSVSIAGDISSQLHAGYSHPLTRSWQAERQLTKVCPSALDAGHRSLISAAPVYVDLPSIHHRQSR